MSYKSIYAASKVYVKYFTEALRIELKQYNVSVSLLQPGATYNDIVKIKTKMEDFARLSVTAAIAVAKAVMSTLNKQPIIIQDGKIECH